MRELRANTEVIVIIGPFPDVGNGFTPQTDIDISGTNEAELLKHGSDTVVDISGATWAAVTDCRGHYALTLTTGYTDTEGMLRVVIQDDSDCLPVKEDFMVLSEAAYDSKYVAKDAGFMDVNIKTIGRSDTQETEANNLENFCSSTGYAGGTIKLESDLTSIHGSALTETASGRIVAAFKKLFDIASPVLTTASVNQGADNNTILSSINIANGAVEADLTRILGTALTESAGQIAAGFKKLFDVATPLLVASDVMRGTDSAALASDYTAARAVFLDNLDISENVAGTSEVGLTEDTVRGRIATAPLYYVPSGAAVTYRIWWLHKDNLNNMEDPDAAPTIGVENGAQVSRSANLNSTTMTKEATGEYYEDYTLDSAHLDEQLDILVTAVEGGLTQKYRLSLNATSSQAELAAMYAALFTTHAELGSIPAAAAGSLNKLELLFMALKNKYTSTATQADIHDDGGSSIGSATLSDDNTTLTKGEFA